MGADGRGTRQELKTNDTPEGGVTYLTIQFKIIINEYIQRRENN